MQSRRSQYGGGGFSTLLWLALIGGAVYFAIMFVPAYAENYEVKRVLREAVNEAVRVSDDDKIRTFIMERCKKVGSHYEIKDGQEMNVPGIVLLDDDVFVNRDTDANEIVLQVEYDQHLYFPFTKKEKVMHFSPSVKGDISPVVW